MSKRVKTVETEIKEIIKKQIIEALKSGKKIEIDISEYIKKLYEDKRLIHEAIEHIMREYFNGNEEIQRKVEGHIIDANPSLFSDLGTEYQEELKDILEELRYDYIPHLYDASGSPDPVAEMINELVQSYIEEIICNIEHYVNKFNDLEDYVDSISAELRSVLGEHIDDDEYEYYRPLYICNNHALPSGDEDMRWHVETYMSGEKDYSDILRMVEDDFETYITAELDETTDYSEIKKAIDKGDIEFIEEHLPGLVYDDVLEAIEQCKEYLEAFNQIVTIMKKKASSVINFNNHPELAEFIDDSQSLYDLFETINSAKKALTDFKIEELDWLDFSVGFISSDEVPVLRHLKDWTTHIIYGDDSKEKSIQDEKDSFSILEYLPESAYVEILKNIAKKHNLEIVVSPIEEGQSFLDKYKLSSRTLGIINDEEFKDIMNADDAELHSILEACLQSSYESCEEPNDDYEDTYEEPSMYDPYTRMRKKPKDYRDDYCDNDDCDDDD